MKKILITAILGLAITTAFSQINWRKGGNAQVPPFAPSSIGTDASWNAPFEIMTNGIGRMLIENGGVGFAAGRVAMGNNLPLGFAAQDRLHLHQNVRGPLIRFTNNGTGSFNTDGFRVGINDVAIATLQNFENTAMEFYNTNIERMHINADNGTTDGFIGMGNGFNNPQSHLHINNPTNQETWMQITHNQTGQTNTDGLRLGIINTTGGVQPSVAFLRWHEKSPFIIQTGGSTISGSTINEGERIRISAIGAPTDNPDPFNVQGNETRIGISHNSLSIGTSTPITRIRSLLHLGYNIGEMVGNIALNDGWRSWMDVGTFTSVGRENMYFGFKQEITGGVIGLLPEDSHYEAIINWGDNEIASAGERNTNLRFIYTTPQIGTVNTPQSQVDGLEAMRIEPTVATTLTAPNFGMVGIGDFSPTGPNSAATDVVNAKLDIDGDLRIRTVTEVSDLTQVLVIDPTDQNRVHWRNIDDLGNGINCWDTNGDGIDDPSEDTDGNLVWDALDCQGAIGPQGPVGATGPQGPAGTGGGTVTADNGLHIFGSNNVRLGGSLVENTAIDLSGNLLSFEGVGYVGIGAPYFSSMLNIKNTGNWLNVLRIANTLDEELLTFSDGKRLSIHAVNDPNVSLEQAVSINCNLVDDNAINTRLYGLDVSTTSFGTTNAYSGARIMAVAKNNSPSPIPITGLFVAARSPIDNGTSDYIGIVGVADRGTSGKNIGVWGSAANISSQNIGIYGTGTGTGNFGGYFEGDVHVVGAITATGTITSISDQLFKQNIQPIVNATTLLNQLQPKFFNLDSANYTQLNFDNKQHMGLIAQDVELILPNLVSNNVILAQTDSLGNEITPQLNYKGLNYQELIPLMIAGMKEQQQTIDRLLEEMDDLKNCLHDANICTEGNRTMNTEPDNNTNNKSIELVNTNSIILQQNLPNPFAENTVINYNIPAEVAKAKLLFYDLNGRIIKELIIEERGESKLTVYGTNLKTGVYTYSLIADGELIATKKMVKK